jgi:hypothetical protein
VDVSFADEVKVLLPVDLSATHHILFSLYHISHSHATKEERKAERLGAASPIRAAAATAYEWPADPSVAVPIGHAVLRLFDVRCAAPLRRVPRCPLPAGVSGRVARMERACLPRGRGSSATRRIRSPS